MATATTSPENTMIQLAPPGAGLPPMELRVARLLFRWRMWRGDARKFARRLHFEREKVRGLYSSCDNVAASRPVLITRLRGMEDSSRNWSVWMTLDHLRMVNNSIAGIIKTLAAGNAPTRVASTAAVKPSPKADGTVIINYEASCGDVLEAAESSPNLRTPVRFAHPWFGSLDAFSWFGLAGFHMGIHRQQIEKILEGFSRKE